MTLGTSFLTDPLIGAATKITRKPGQRWEYGPICFAGERKAYVTELATYLQWVGQVESALSDPAAAAQRIRMLYYGGAAGYLPELDTLLVSNPAWAGAPLTTANVPQDTLDGLMGTGWVSVGVNQDRRRLVDISHVWLLLDAAFNKVSGLGQQVVQTPLTGLMSWAGHLASWWIEYNAQKICAQRALPAGQTLTEDPANLTVPTGWLTAGQPVWCATDDLFGDMDGVILAALGVPLVRAGSSTLANLLQRYYAGKNANPSDRTFLHSDNRFHLFVRNCAPAIPFDDAGSGAAALNTTSGPAVRALLTTAVSVLLANARGASPGYLKGMLECPVLSFPSADEAEQSVQKDISSPWGAAMINQAADAFTASLTAGLAGTGWTSGAWPTSVFALDSARRGGVVLQFGDNDTGTYGGAAHAPASFVANLQNDLLTLGFTGVFTADGSFFQSTALALREFQIEASQPQILARGTPGPVPTVLPAIRRYRGPVNGVATLETCQALAQWLQPDPPPRHCLAAPGPGHGLLQLLNPISISSRTGVSASSNGTIVGADMWWYGDTGSTDATNPEVYAADLLQRYPIPGSEIIGTDPGLARIGRYADTAYGNGPVLQQQDWWASSLITLANLVPPPFDPNSPAIQSLYRVVRAVANVEDIGHYDVYNAYDSAILSFGLLHWALLSGGVGELGAFLSFYQSTNPVGYAADFGSIGIQSGSAWDPTKIDPVLRIYTGTLAMCGLHDRSGTIQASQVLPLQIGTVSNPSPDRYVSDWLRSWRGLHRLAMTLRTSSSLRYAMWYFATQRVSNLLSIPWPGGSGVDCPVVTVGGVQTLATVGQVFNSEQAAAALLRWHVNQPGSLLAITPVFNIIAIQQAFTGTFGGGIVNLSAIAKSDMTNLQQFLVKELIGLAPTADLKNTIPQAAGYKDKDAGPLSAVAYSYIGS
jgi:hypothetical protein